MRKVIQGLALVSAFAAVNVAAPVASAYDQSEYTGNGQPQINVYTTTDGWGDETDFLRVGPTTAKFADATDEHAACEGEVKVFVYVHNGAPEGYNGENNTGPGVAKDVRVKATVPTGKGKTRQLAATISASNAASVTDTAKINCAGEDVEVSYVENSAQNISLKAAAHPLDDPTDADGTLIGTNGKDGIVPGCWEFRNYVSFKVKVTKVVTPEEPEQPEEPETPEQPRPEQPRPEQPAKPKEEKPAPKPSMPVTGVSGVAGLFAATSAVGAGAHRLFVSRRRR